MKENNMNETQIKSDECLVKLFELPNHLLGLALTEEFKKSLRACPEDAFFDPAAWDRLCNMYYVSPKYYQEINDLNARLVEVVNGHHTPPAINAIMTCLGGAWVTVPETSMRNLYSEGAKSLFSINRKYVLAKGLEKESVEILKQSGDLLDGHRVLVTELSLAMVLLEVVKILAGTGNN